MKTSIEICFVCGSKGASNIIHVRPHAEGQPYFSFLESHIPPRGARRPNSSGVVNSCTVCFAFLNQQWDTFERSRTPLVKRLYWLKRVDNGTFTGAEMSVQGEYMAQLMGLHGIGASACGTSLFGAGNQSGIPCGEVPSPASPEDCESIASEYANGALDLSVSPRKPESKGRKPRNSDVQPLRSVNSTRKKGNGALSDNVVCYICGVVCSSSLARFIYALKQSSDEPYFPFVLALSAPPGAMPVTKTGVTRVCADCRKSLTRQWRIFESRSIAERDRTYRVGNCSMTVDLSTMAGTVSNGKDYVKGNESTVCYICAEPNSFSRMKWIATRSNVDSEMVFPFVARLESPPQAVAISSNGLARICEVCYHHLEKQWKLFETKGIPLAGRNYVFHQFIKNSEILLKLANVFDVRSTYLPNNLLTSALEQSKTERAITKMKKEVNISGILMDYSINSQNETPSQEMRQRLQGISKSCFVCSVECDGDLLDDNGDCYTLSSKPTDNQCSDSCEDSKAKLSNPFFPFLEQLEQTPSNGSATKKLQSFDVCAICYWCLVRQWRCHEQLRDVSELGRWERSYQYKVVPCDWCHKQVHRADITIVSYAKSVERSSVKSDRIALVCMSCRRKSACQPNGVDENGMTYDTSLRSTTTTPFLVAARQISAGARTSAELSDTAPAAEVRDARPLSVCSRSSGNIDSVDHKTNGDGKPSAELPFGCHRLLNSSDETRSAVNSSCSLNLRTVSPTSNDLHSSRERPVSSDSMSCSDRHSSGSGSRLTPRDVRSALAPSFSPYADHGGGTRTSPSLVRPQSVDNHIGRLMSSLGLQSLSSDPVTSSALLMMQNYLMQQSPHLAALNPLMSIHYPGLPSLLSSVGPMMRPPNLEMFLPPSDTSSSMSVSSKDRQKDKEDHSTGQHSKDSEFQSGYPMEANLSDRLTVANASGLPRDSQGGSTCKSSEVVTKPRPIFYRPFLDDHVVTSSAGCSNGNLKAELSPSNQSEVSHYFQTSDQLTKTKEDVLKLPVHVDADRVESPVASSHLPETPTNDGRLSAALGLISLAARAEPTCLNAEANGDHPVRSPSIAKRPRLESLSDSQDAAYESRSVSSSEAVQSQYSDRPRRCSWDTNCVIGKKLVAGGYGASEMSFSWPGIATVIEAYMQHLQEERVERLVLSEQQLRLKSLHQKLTDSAVQLAAKLEEAQLANSELASQRVQLETAIGNLKSCLKFPL